MLHGVSGMMIGSGLLAVGLIIIFFSPYRRWLGFMGAGMVFWCFLELNRIVSQYIFGLGDFQGYMFGVGVALALLATWLAATEKKLPQPIKRHIEHTPVHDDEIVSLFSKDVG